MFTEIVDSFKERPDGLDQSSKEPEFAMQSCAPNACQKNYDRWLEFQIRQIMFPCLLALIPCLWLHQSDYRLKTFLTLGFPPKSSQHAMI